MNYLMIKRLILKDWYLQSLMIYVAIGAGAVSLAITVFGGKPGFILGMVALVTVLIFMGAQLAISTTVLERREQTLAFVMSLPISYREFTTAKIVGSMIIFLVPWGALMFGGIALILATAAIPHGLVPYVTIMGTEILVSTVMVISVALMSESQGWSTAAILTGSLSLNVFGYFVAHIESIGRGMWGPTIGWSTAATEVLLAEFGAVVLLLGLTFLVQSRKRDFL